MKKAQQRFYFLHQMRKFNLPQELLIQFYSAIIESVLCTSISVWFSSATKSDLRRLWGVVRTTERIIGKNPPLSLRNVPIQSEQKGWQNYSGPLTSSTLPLLTVTFRSLNMEHTALLYNYLFTTHTYSFLFQICTCQTSHIIACIVYCVFAILYIAYLCIVLCCLCPVLSLSS